MESFHDKTQDLKNFLLLIGSKFELYPYVRFPSFFFRCPLVEKFEKCWYSRRSSGLAVPET